MREADCLSERSRPGRHHSARFPSSPTLTPTVRHGRSERGGLHYPAWRSPFRPKPGHIAVSEATLLILYGLDLTTVTVGALIASLAGTDPVLLVEPVLDLERGRSRERIRRQVILYWIVSISCIVPTSLLTGALASLAPAGHCLHLLEVAIGHPIVMLAFWLIKFFIDQRVIFPNGPNGMAPGAQGDEATDVSGVSATGRTASATHRALQQVRAWCRSAPALLEGGPWLRRGRRDRSTAAPGQVRPPR